MRDVIFVLVTVGFFVLAGAYVTFCDRIARSENVSGAGSVPEDRDGFPESSDTQPTVGIR